MNAIRQFSLARESSDLEAQQGLLPARPLGGQDVHRPAGLADPPLHEGPSMGALVDEFFLFPANADQDLSFTLERKHFPFYARSATGLTVSSLDLIVESGHPGSFNVQLTLPGTAATAETMPRDAALNQVHHLIKKPAGPPVSALGKWSLKIQKDTDADFRSLTSADLKEAYLIIGFTMK
jgi:hypothetical protein